MLRKLLKCIYAALQRDQEEVIINVTLFRPVLANAFNMYKTAAFQIYVRWIGLEKGGRFSLLMQEDLIYNV